MNNHIVAFKSIRFPFLILTPVSIFLAYSTAIFNQQQVPIELLIAVLTSALFAHISVNTLNEYQDYKSGLDFKTHPTPFSGGSGTLVKNPDLERKVLNIFIFSLSILVLSGVYFIFLRGWPVILFGAAGIAIILSYTNWINKHPWLCLFSPGFAFGPLMILGSNYIFLGEFNLVSIAVSMVVFCLVNNLLLLNQIPDITADSSIGRRHFSIAFGRIPTIIAYLILNITAVIIILLGVYLKLFPTMLLIALIPISFFVITSYGVNKFYTDIPNLIPFLGINVNITVLTPIFIAFSLII